MQKSLLVTFVGELAFDFWILAVNLTMVWWGTPFVNILLSRVRIMGVVVGFSISGVVFWNVAKLTV